MTCKLIKVFKGRALKWKQSIFRSAMFTVAFVDFDER